MGLILCDLRSPRPRPRCAWRRSSESARPAAAGEVTGNGKSTPISVRAKSICAFSGLDDGVALVGFDANVPIFIEVPTGPGPVQNPHMENAAGIPASRVRSAAATPTAISDHSTRLTAYGGLTTGSGAPANT